MIPPKAVGYFVPANIVLPFFATIAVALRIYARKIKSVPLRDDDYTIISSLIVTLVVSGIGIYSACTGLSGVSLFKMSSQTYRRYNKAILGSLLTSHIAFGLAKISILLFYKRIFDTQKFRLAANIALAIASGWMIAAFFGYLFSAKGVSSFWTTPIERTGTQYNFNFPLFLTTISSLDIATDVGILCLPIPMVLGLHMNFGRKLILLSLFMMGFFCVISSSLKLHYAIKLQHVEETTQNPESYELTYLSSLTDLWASIECSSSIITACLPTLRPLFQTKSAESMINSVKNAFPVFMQRKNANTNHNLPFASSDGPKGPWHELRNSKTGSARENSVNS